MTWFENTLTKEHINVQTNCKSLEKSYHQSLRKFLMATEQRTSAVRANQSSSPTMALTNLRETKRKEMAATARVSVITIAA
jgi:hypothetical protein